MLASPTIGYGEKICRGCQQPNCIPEDVVQDLTSHGIRRPVASLMDPRLSFPELFLKDGWRRTETEAGVRYSCEAGEASQSVDFGESRWRRVVSRLPERTQVVQMTLDGRVQQWVQSDSLPALDASLRQLETHYDAFRESGELLMECEERPLSPTEALARKAAFRSEMDSLHQLDESEADQARPFPGEVRTDTVQGRFWGSPCGWQMSRWEQTTQTTTIARSNGFEVWSVESDGRQIRATYINELEPETSFEQRGLLDQDPECFISL